MGIELWLLVLTSGVCARSGLLLVLLPEWPNQVRVIDMIWLNGASRQPIMGLQLGVSSATFLQGTAGDPCGQADETPFEHQLTRSLLVMQTEVTQKMWADLRAEQWVLPEDPSSLLHGAGPDHPVQNVTWYEAILFANLLSRELGLTPCYYLDPQFLHVVNEENYCDGDMDPSNDPPYAC